MNEITIKDWNDLNDVLFKDTWNKDIKRHRSTFAYRGVSDKNFKLSNGLSRIGDYKSLEKNLIKQFKKYAHRDMVTNDTDWHWLSIAQHYGLPTRLLDWTYSPYVALHFATSDILDHKDVDAAVWKVNYAETNNLLQDGHTKTLKKYGSKIFSVDSLSESIKSTKKLDSLHSSHSDSALFFEPPAIDDRIVNQFGYFSVISDPFMSFDDWLEQNHVKEKVSATKIIIPSKLRWEIRDKLDQSNITERVLMPGLDGLCSWLKRHYSSRD